MVYTQLMLRCLIGHLQDMVNPHDLGVAIQQETPQLLMEGDTLDDHVTPDDQPKCHDQDTIHVGVQEETVNSLCDQSNIMELLLSTTGASHDGIHDIDQLSVHSSTYSLGSSTSFTSSSEVLDSVSTPVDHVTASKDHVITLKDHVITSLDHVVTPNDHVITPIDHVTTPTDRVIATEDHVNTPECHITLPDLGTNADENGISLAMNFTETSIVRVSSCTSVMTHTNSSLSQASSSMAQLNSSVVNSSSVNTSCAITLLAAAAAASGTIPCSIIVPLSLPDCGYVPSASSQCSVAPASLPHTGQFYNLFVHAVHYHCSDFFIQQ